MGATGAESPSRATAARAPLLEVFPSLQGEGLYVGEPQVFLRTRGCPLRCTYCDTPESWPLGKGDADSATAFQAVLRVAEAESKAAGDSEGAIGSPRTVSWTGGEPLEWPEFGLALAPLLGGRRLHLETSGAFPNALARLLDSVDHVSLDLKLPSDMRNPVAWKSGASEGAPASADGEPAPAGADDWREVRRLALGMLIDRDAAGKIVITPSSDLGDVADAIEDVVELSPSLPVFVQPASPVRGVEAPSDAQVAAARELALESGVRVRVLPQIHRLLGLR